MSGTTIRTILILFAAAATYLIGNAKVTLWDRDEPRYAQCSRQMLQSGDWVVPRLYDRLRPQKPPLIYWCQATCMRVLGQAGDAGAFAARLPSVLAMLTMLGMLAVVIRRAAGPEQAMWTVFILATSILPIFAAKICLTDSVLTLFVIVAQLCLYRLWHGSRSWRLAVVLGLALGLGMLTKGPFIVGIVASTAAAMVLIHYLNRRTQNAVADESLASSGSLASVIGEEGRREGSSVKEIRNSTDLDAPPLTLTSAPNTGAREKTAATALRLGYTELPPAKPAPLATSPRFTPTSIAIIVVAAIIAGAMFVPWVLLVRHRAPEFIGLILNEARAHTMEGKEGHGFPPGYHLVMMWPMFMPWSLLLPLGMVVGFANRRDPRIHFALAAVLGPWVMVELMATKLPHYFLSAYPAMAYLVAFSILRCLRGQSQELSSTPFRIAAIIWAIAAACIGSMPWLAVWRYRPLPWAAMSAMSVYSLLYAGSVLIFILTRRFAGAFWTMGLGMLGAIVLIYTVYLPHADFMRISPHVAAVLQEQGATHPGDVRMIDYKEPSLGFYQGGTIREEQNESLLFKQPMTQWPRWLVMTRPVWDAMPREKRGELTVVDRCRGWAYADKGRSEEVMVVTRAPLAPAAAP